MFNEYSLVLDNVYKKYEQSTEYAVEGLSFKVKEGEFISLLGPSGCGKTTTMRMIAGLESITKGSIYIGGIEANNIPAKERSIGLAFENYALYPPLSVYENIAFGLKARGESSEKIDKEVRNISHILGIDNILDAKVTNLVEGDKQRVNIARALVRKPTIVLLDEPMSHLDGRTRATLRVELKRLHKEIHSTTILVTHDQLEALSMADRVAVMNAGKLHQFDTSLGLYENPADEFVAGFIGDPPMNLFKVYVKKENQDLYFIFQQQTSLRLKVPKVYSDLLHNDMEVDIGVRPTSVLISPDGSEVIADIVENMVDEQRISIKIGEDELLNFNISRTYKVSEGDRIRIKFNEKQLYIFDPTTGKNIYLNSKVFE